MLPLALEMITRKGIDIKSIYERRKKVDKVDKILNILWCFFALATGALIIFIGIHIGNHADYYYGNNQNPKVEINEVEKATKWTK